jgi:spore coat protein U-like protein
MEFAMLMSSLGYQLFTDNTFAAQWGSGITGGATLGGSGTGSLVTRTIAGRINVGELAPAGGPYTDSVLVTLAF